MRIESLYPIVIGEDALDSLSGFVAELNPSSIFILTDENVDKHCIPVLFTKYPSLKPSTKVVLEPGEANKNISSTEKILSILLDKMGDRKCLLLNIGGGVIGDLGGFVASIYKRGIRFVNIPTTLLSMVDASVGGKNGINFGGNKNIVGTFSKPSGVFIYPGFIVTQDPRDKRSGYAEIIKHVLISDPSLLRELQLDSSRILEKQNIDDLISHSVRYKLGITESDFREDGTRKILNFGHTIGHALESLSQNQKSIIRHGEAVAAGMVAELFLSFKLVGFPEDEMLASVHLIRNVFHDINFNCPVDELYTFLYSDKKNSSNEIAFTLLKAPGQTAGIVYPDKESISESVVFMSDIFSRSLAS